MVKAHTSKVTPVEKLERVHVREDGSLRLAVVSDTHSLPHPRALEWLRAERPDWILHAGDIGELRVLNDLAKVCPVLAVRGNVDVRLPGLPDVLVVEIQAKEGLVVKILMLHVGVYGAKLRADVARLAREKGAAIVVCGHSHVPFMGSESGVTVFNPGSVGPRRFGLPIVFGTMDVGGKGLSLAHIDCETGLPWEPPVV